MPHLRLALPCSRLCLLRENRPTQDTRTSYNATASDHALPQYISAHSYRRNGSYRPTRFNPRPPQGIRCILCSVQGGRHPQSPVPGGTEGEDFRAEHTKNTVDYWHKSPTQYTLKCVDSETGEIVGMALWDVFLKERTYDEYKFPGITWLKGEERARAEELITPICDVKAKLWGGRPHVCEWNP